MSDSDKLRPHTTPTESSEGEDESIIDLVEEIEEDTPPDALPSLDPSMPAIGQLPDAAGTPAAGFADLGKLDFDEEEDQPEGDDLSLGPAANEPDALALEESMDWLLEPEADAPSTEDDQRPDASVDTNWVNTELNETAPATAAILETMVPPSIETDSGNEDDDIELIDIEDDEDDDEIVWFDDLDLGEAPPAAELSPETDAPAYPLSDADADLFPETSAADVFAANVAAGSTITDSAPADLALPTAIASAVASLAPPSPASPIQPPAPEEPPIADRVSLSDEQIGAALERVIERRLGSTLESLVLRAVETAVANEIQRLKTLLLDDDSDDRTP